MATNMQPDVEKDYAYQEGSHNGSYQEGSGIGNGSKVAGRNNGSNHLGSEMDSDTALQRIRTAGSISMSPELFEKIYLSPENKVKGELRKTFGNPTPIALCGFLLSLSPLCCDLMGWRGAGGSGAANTGAYYGFGAILMLLGSILEWVLGNTFPSVVFASFSAFWFTFGSTLVPSFNAAGAYGGSTDPGFAASFAFFLVFMGLLCFIYLIASLRTNIFFVTIFFTLVCAFGCLAGTYWHLAKGDASAASKLQTAGGAFTFVTCMSGWYLFFVQILASVDFPVNLPVGDLSSIIKGGADKVKKT